MARRSSTSFHPHQRADDPDGDQHPNGCDAQPPSRWARTDAEQVTTRMPELIGGNRRHDATANLLDADVVHHVVERRGELTDLFTNGR